MREQIDAPPAYSNEFWHARHACGHAVYWNSIKLAVEAAPWPCPWCGGESGKKMTQDVTVMQDPNVGLLAFRNTLPDGRIPWPGEATTPARIVVHHLPDESCCDSLASRPDDGGQR